MRTLLAVIGLALAAAATAVAMSFFIVHQNQTAIVLQFGDPVRIIEKPGLHWKMPVVQNVEYFDKRILDLDTAPQELTASDQKRLVVDAFTRYRIVDPLKFYQAVRTEARVRQTLGPIIDSALAPDARRRQLPGRRA